MIAVIADDFTGAAEIGGIGLRYGLKVEIETRIKKNCMADILIIATDTRSKKVSEAVKDIKQITTELMKLKPVLIYKKIDSVLRGHIVAELAAQMKISHKHKALVIPANPEQGRTIKDGIYYLKEKKLHQTSFRYDPEFAITSSNVINLLEDDNKVDIVVKKPDTELPAEGIIIGEAYTTNDLSMWAKNANHLTLLAGASGFFSALLEHRGYSRNKKIIRTLIKYKDKRMLFVCGSTFSTSKELISKSLVAGASLSLMPAALINATGIQLTHYQHQWAADIISLFTRHHYVILSVDPKTQYSEKETAKKIRSNTAMVVKKVMEQLSIQELMLEGGSTASAVLGELQLERFYPEQELAHGVIRMSIPESNALHITLKPGSYDWPFSFRAFANNLKYK